MYHRGIGDDESKYTAAHVAESIRTILMRATILLVILLAAPIMYETLTGGSLNHLAGTDDTTWETIQWGMIVITIFVILGLVGVASIIPRCDIRHIGDT